GVLFGTVRGLAVLLARGITTPAGLASFHRRFAELEVMSRRVIVVMELAVASVVAGVLWPPAAVVVVVAAAIGWAVVRQVHVPEGDCEVARPGAVSTSPVESGAGLDPVSASEATPALG
ncbi:MAG TPA: hypothetical protein VGF11_05420, partial [Acidimicrobiales bacterium]